MKGVMTPEGAFAVPDAGRTVKMLNPKGGHITGEASGPKAGGLFAVLTSDGQVYDFTAGELASGWQWEYLAAPSDPINPSHYKRGGMEAIDVIEAFELDYHLGSAVAYVLRAGHKGPKLEDLRKAAWYIQRAIAVEDACRGGR